jgi:hypothetical protein
VRTILVRAAALACAAGVALPSAATPQSLTDRLSSLFTADQRSSVYVPDPGASAATSDAVVKLFSIELVNQPLPAASAGVIYRLEPQLGVVARATEGFGPFFTERVLRGGSGNLSAGVSLQAARFSSLQGVDLESGAFASTAQKNIGAAQPFAVDYVTLELESQTMSAFLSYGLTDRLSIGSVLPFVRVRMNGTRSRFQQGRFTPLVGQSGWATGLGDIALNARFQVAGSGLSGVSIGGDFRLPTGKSEDLLGAGRTSGRALLIGSWEEGRYGLNGNAAFGFGGISRAIEWNGAATFAVTPRVTLVGELLFRRLSELDDLDSVYRPHSTVRGVETMVWQATDRIVNTGLLAVGGRWNVSGSWLLNTNVLVRVTEGGLRSRLTPSISFDYDFGS